MKNKPFSQTLCISTIIPYFCNFHLSSTRIHVSDVIRIYYLLHGALNLNTSSVTHLCIFLHHICLNIWKQPLRCRSNVNYRKHASMQINKEVNWNYSGINLIWCLAIDVKGCFLSACCVNVPLMRQWEVRWKRGQRESNPLHQLVILHIMSVELNMPLFVMITYQICSLSEKLCNLFEWKLCRCCLNA